MRFPPLANRPVIAGVLLMLAFSSLSVLSLASEQAEIDAVGGSVGLKDGDIKTEAGAGVGNLVQVNASVDIDPGAIDIELLGIGSHATFEFDLPLFDRSSDERFRFRAADGTHRDAVTIEVTWRDGNGDPKPFPTGDRDDATLVLVHDGKRTTYQPTDRPSDSVAVFTIPMATLVQGRATDWAIMAHAGNEDLQTGLLTVGAMSAYNRGGDSHSELEARIDDLLDLWSTPIWVFDTDEDSHPNDVDNCPRVANRDQANMDRDLHGDACDNDVDGDGHDNDAETSAGSDPRNFASTPDDRDADGFDNDAESSAGSDPDNVASTPDDPDADGFPSDEEMEAGSDPFNDASTPDDPDADGFDNDADNCPVDSNSDQTDGDGDRIGDACDGLPDDGPDGDHDGDGISNRNDLCPRDPNASQDDMDGDGRGDACDKDRDGDDVRNRRDAFPDDAREWSDNDNDGIGDNADSDDDNDGLSDDAEAAMGTSPTQADTDGDRLSDFEELRLSTDPLDRFDPDTRPTDLKAIGQSDGSVRIEWTGTDDPRVAAYTVWSRDDLRLVAEVSAQGAVAHTVVDSSNGRGDALYAIQAHYHDDPRELSLEDAMHVPLFAEEVDVWSYEAPKDLILQDPGAATTTRGQPPIASGGRGIPNASILFVGAAFAVAMLGRRR